MEEESAHKEEMKGWRAIVLGGTGATGRVRASHSNLSITENYGRSMQYALVDPFFPHMHSFGTGTGARAD